MKRSSLQTWIRKYTWLAVLCLFSGSILWTAFTANFGYVNLSLWPWNKAWYVFSRAHSKNYQIQVWGIFENGENRQVDMTRWFKYPVGGTSRRFNEMRRDKPTMTRLANFVCAKINDEGEATSEKIEKIAVLDALWLKDHHARVAIKTLKNGEISYYYYVRNHPCPKS